MYLTEPFFYRNLIIIYFYMSFYYLVIFLIVGWLYMYMSWKKHKEILVYIKYKKSYIPLILITLFNKIRKVWDFLHGIDKSKIKWPCWIQIWHKFFSISHSFLYINIYFMEFYKDMATSVTKKNGGRWS